VGNNSVCFTRAKQNLFEVFEERYTDLNDVRSEAACHGMFRLTIAGRNIFLDTTLQDQEQMFGDVSATV
jgi:hypothetical protein